MLALVCAAFMGKAQSTNQQYTNGAGLMVDVGEGVTFVGPHIKHFFTPNHAGEAALMFGGHATSLQAMYQYNQEINDVRGLQWYLGLGANVIFQKAVDATFGIVPAAGLDYKIMGAPIDAFFDWRPKFMMYSGDSEFVAARFGLGLRFTF